jgi:hypothetical protein
VHYESPDGLRRSLETLGLLPGSPVSGAPG